mmetsp:Transcript_14968/g.40381  ORF Transcript_14968/g.40381 Transcript_14968/m.40381 type:complete len:99 (-) Transcript_14968:333-629(-)|eukprot:113331-Pelagomonas_calceolata.AAC.2
MHQSPEIHVKLISMQRLLRRIARGMQEITSVARMLHLTGRETQPLSHFPIMIQRDPRKSCKQAWPVAWVALAATEAAAVEGAIAPLARLLLAFAALGC